MFTHYILVIFCLEVDMRKRKQKKQALLPLKVDELEKIVKRQFASTTGTFPDLVFNSYVIQNEKVAVFYLSNLINSDKLENSILEPLLSSKKPWTNEDLLNEIPIGESNTANTLEDINTKIILGEVFIYVEQEEVILAYSLIKKEKRSLEKAETESLVLGPKIAFTESIITNINIVRWRIRSPELVIEEFTVGGTVPRDVRVVYMKSIANQEDVNTVKQRIRDLDVDEIEDSIVLKQYMEDDQFNLFPQLEITELPDKFSYGITKGKVGVLVENSPSGIIAPANLFSFLESTEDLYMRWQAGSFLRILRFIAMFFSIIITPIYVAIVSFQYDVIPTKLLITVGQSRANVPFSPILEALLLEFLIELLREAGARLPTKVGQTMGIVGGIVIGQAAVAAGITSNILLIVVSMSALASFTTPSYLLGTTIRIIRMPLIILAGSFGLFGLMWALCFLIIHLLKLTSLGRPFLTPLYPLRLQDFNKVFYRLPVDYTAKRMEAYRPKKLKRFSKKEATKKRDIEK